MKTCLVLLIVFDHGGKAPPFKPPGNDSPASTCQIISLTISEGDRIVALTTQNVCGEILCWSSGLYGWVRQLSVQKTCLLNVINGRIYCQTTLATGWCKTFLMLKTFSFKVFYFYSVLQWTPVIKLEPLWLKPHNCLSWPLSGWFCW